MMENVLPFLRAAAPWISMGLLIAFLCVRPAIRKGKAEDDYAEEGMCVGMCLGSLSDSSNSGLGASLGMLFGLVIGLCVHKKRKMTIAAMRNKCCSHPHDQQMNFVPRSYRVWRAPQDAYDAMIFVADAMPIEIR